jgi:hypothetical protein
MGQDITDEELVSAPQRSALKENVAWQSSLSATPTIWTNVGHAALRRLISEQIPRFRLRPYLADASALSSALAAGLESSLDGDYCWSLCFSPEFVRSLTFEGFLPICSEVGGGTGLFVLLPKLHAQRCVLHFGGLHVPKKV